MLTLQVLRSHGVVHAQYRESDDASLMASVYPGGTLMGFSFAKLCDMGSGEHRVVSLDPHDVSSTGAEPAFKSEWEAKVAHFQFVLFGYQVGAYTALEVLHVAQKVLAVRHANEA